MRQAGRSAIRAADADRPVGARRDESRRCRARRRAARSPARPRSRGCSGGRRSRKPGAPGSRSTTASPDAAARAPPRAGRAVPGPAPRTSRRGLRGRGSLSTTPHSRDTTRRCARDRPRRTCARASRAAARLVGRADVPVDLAGPLRVRARVRSAGLPSTRSTSSAMSETEMSTPVATLSTSPAIALDRRLDHGLDRLGVVGRRRASRARRARRRGSSAARRPAPA